MDKLLFLEDLKGLNGEVAQQLVLDEIGKFFDSGFKLEEIEELEAALDEKDEEIEELEEKIEKLEKKNIALRRRNHLLKCENFGLGNILDTVAIQKGIDIYDISLD